MREWLIQNRQWLFDGLGTAILLGIAGFVVRQFRKRAPKPGKQVQISGNNSINMQAGYDLNINSPRSGIDGTNSTGTEKRR